MVTAVIIAACFVVIGLMRSALQWLVAWVLGARPLHLIVGIGPALVRRDVGGTPFEIRAVPLGGHVQWGDTPYVVPAPGPWGARLALALSGPLATVILAFFLLFGLHVSFQARTVDGRPVATNVVALPLNTAVAAGIRPGDVITQIDGQSVEFYDEITALVGRSGGRALQVTVQRPPPGTPSVDDHIRGTLSGRSLLGPNVTDTWSELALSVQPDPTPQGYALGLEPRAGRFGTDRWLPALEFAGAELGASLVELLGPRPGPLTIMPTSEAWWGPLFHLLAQVALMAFIVNLALPAHDLHRLFLLAFEAVFRRPLKPAPELALVRLEVLIVLALIVAWIARDVVRLLNG
jgi:regulator of sigma E protease